MKVANLPQAHKQHLEGRSWFPLLKMHSEIDRMFNDLTSGFFTESQDDVYSVKSDIIETKDDYKLLMDVPGFQKRRH